MNRLEGTFWDKIKANLHIDFIERVENRIAVGWPDVHYCHGPNSGWIELKATQTFPNSVPFEPGQPIWLERYWEAGGECFVWLYVAKENAIYIWLGKHAKKLDRAGGTKEIEPFLKVKIDEGGWVQLYDIFKLLPVHLVA